MGEGFKHLIRDKFTQTTRICLDPKDGRAVITTHRQTG